MLCLLRKIKILGALFAFICYLNVFSYISFFESMEAGTKDYNNKYSSSSSLKYLNLLSNIYNFHSKRQYSKGSKVRIPKIIHQIWIGPNPFPKFYKMLSDTWKEKHPDWKYILWTDKEVKKLKLLNQHLYDKSKSYIEKSDILRLEILNQFGGIYVDTDFECLKSLGNLNCYYDFYTGIGPSTSKSMTPNGFIASAPGHPIIKECINKAYEFVNNKKLFYNGSMHFAHEVKKYLLNNYKLSDSNNRFIAFPVSYFYPAPKIISNHSLDPLKEYLKPESFAVHHWGHGGNNIKSKILYYKLVHHK